MSPTQVTAVPYARAPIFFLHIPKTAGSALNGYCVNWFGSERSLLHVESVVGVESVETVECTIDWTVYDFVSGHLTVPMMQRLIEIHEWVTVTMVREPFQQVLSHLKWLREIGCPGRSDSLGDYPVEFQEIALGLYEYDLESPSDVRALIYWLETIGFDYFHDCQTLYLDGESRDLERALENLAEFDVVGLSEDPGRVIEALARKGYCGRNEPGHIEPRNVQTGVPRHACDDPEMRHALFPLVRRDLPLYEGACRIVNQEN